jgi:hypothetical protein
VTDEDEDILMYSSSLQKDSEKSESSYALRVCDSIPTVGVITDCAIGESMDLASESHLVSAFALAGTNKL